MARPLHADLFARICSVPTSVTLLACLSLPQVRDCHGHVKTAAENGTSPLLIVMAMIALAPLAWCWPVLRSVVVALAIGAAAIAVMSSVVVLPIALYCVVSRPWSSPEQFVATICAALALVFVVVFPLVGVFATWMVGATLTWITGWIVMIAMGAWVLSATYRAQAVSHAVAGTSHWSKTGGLGTHAPRQTRSQP